MNGFPRIRKNAIKLYDSNGIIINPATEDKQDDIIENQTDGTHKTQIVDSVGTVWGLEPNGGMPVNLQDQTSRILDLEFIQQQGATTTLAADADPEDTTITLTDATGFVAGNVVAIFTTGGDFYFGEQIGAAAGSVITLDTPIDVLFESGSSVIRASNEMAVNGAITTQIFQIGPVGAGTGIEVDVTRIMGYIQDGTAMDDALFGGIAALTYGIVLRKNDTDIQNIWNVKTNGDLGILAYDTSYTTKAPAGSFGFKFRNTFAGQDKHGVTVRLAPGDTLELLVQDDLTGLESFKMMAQGHVVVP
jgi:hypothetical protein